MITYNDTGLILIYTNDNGVTWTVIDIRADQLHENIFFLNNYFYVCIAYHASLSCQILQSSTCLNWTTIYDNNSAENTVFTLLAYGNGKLIAVSRTNYIMYSLNNGLTWSTPTLISVAPANSVFNTLTFGNNVFILTNSNTIATLTNFVLYSSDGINWIYNELPYYNNSKLVNSSNSYIIINNIVFNGIKFFMLLSNVNDPTTNPSGNSFQYIYTSFNGIQWNIENLVLNYNLSATWINCVNSKVYITNSPPTSLTTNTQILNYLTELALGKLVFWEKYVPQIHWKSASRRRKSWVLKIF
jgi:hypothetical protein